MPGISTVTNRVTYQGDGTSAIFAFQFPLFAQGDLGVFAYNSSATTPAIVTAMILNGGGGNGYILSGNQDQAGIYPNGVNVVMNSAPNAQTVMVLFRSSILTNTFQVAQTGAIPSTGLNNELNYLTLLAQRHQDQLTRAARLHDGWAGAFDATLPKNFVPNSTLAFNSSASGFAVGPTVDQILMVQSSAILTNSSVVSATNQAILAGSAALSAANSVATFPAMPYVSGAILFGSSTTKFAQAVVGVNQVLLGGGSSAPSNVTGYGNTGDILTSAGTGLSPTWAAFPAATQADLEAGSSAVVATTPARQQFHPSATKAWISFQAQTSFTNVAAFNCTSLIRHGIGDYSFQFITPMSSANYAVVGMTSIRFGVAGHYVGVSGSSLPTANAVRIHVFNNADTQTDPPYLAVACFGDQ